MYKLLVFCAVLYTVVDARPTWQFLPPLPGYVPVYIRTGDTPLEEINPDLAEAFLALPAGRSAGKQLEAIPDIPELNDQTLVDTPIDGVDLHETNHRQEVVKDNKEVEKPVERR